MSVTEFERHQILQWFQEQLGPERGEIVMDGMRGELGRTLITWMLASQATLVGLVLAAVRFGAG